MKAWLLHVCEGGFREGAGAPCILLHQDDSGGDDNSDGADDSGDVDG